MGDNEKIRAAAMAQVRQFGDPVLKEKSRSTEVDDGLLELIERMTRIMYGANGVGLAAPQIGVLQRAIIFLLEGGLKVLINPEITWKSDETVTDAEGCLSLANLSCDVERAERIKVAGTNLEGERCEYELEGLNARIIQHEIDHLNGTMIIDRTSGDQRKNLLSHLRQMKFPGEE